MEESLRIAFFPDTYDEIDGVANTSRQFEAFAKKRGLDFLIICGGTANKTETEGTVRRITFRRSSFGFPLDTDHTFDLAFWRHYNRAITEVRKFSPDIVHITGPSDAGQLGVLIAHQLGVPLAASWHTNLHEYAERRASVLFGVLPKVARQKTGGFIRESSLSLILRFYGSADLLFAPNAALIDLLARRVNKPVYSMRRGVDALRFTPEKRDRSDGKFTIGYVGRLTVEKNIRFLAELEAELLRSGFSDFRFSIVGQGGDSEWLKANMQTADFSGVLKGDALARAYANLDAFVFPSRTDTFGNVVLEALASGVPAIVTNGGGPRFIVRHGETGFVAQDTGEFVSYIRRLASEPELLRAMRQAARSWALNLSWDRIFGGLYADYEKELRSPPLMSKNAGRRPQQGIVSPRLS